MARGGRGGKNKRSIETSTCSIREERRLYIRKNNSSQKKIFEVRPTRGKRWCRERKEGTMVCIAECEGRGIQKRKNRLSLLLHRERVRDQPRENLLGWLDHKKMTRDHKEKWENMWTALQQSNRIIRTFKLQNCPIAKEPMNFGALQARRGAEKGKRKARLTSAAMLDQRRLNIKRPNNQKVPEQQRKIQGWSCNPSKQGPTKTNS